MKYLVLVALYQIFHGKGLIQREMIQREFPQKWNTYLYTPKKFNGILNAYNELLKWMRDIVVKMGMSMNGHLSQLMPQELQLIKAWYMQSNILSQENYYTRRKADVGVLANLKCSSV